MIKKFSPRNKTVEADKRRKKLHSKRNVRKAIDKQLATGKLTGIQLVAVKKLTGRDAQKL